MLKLKFKQPNFQNIYSRASICLLSLFALLAVLGITSSALAALQQGDRGSEVRTLQQRLRQLRYRVSVTGNFGSQTRNALIQFQQDNGLTPDGIVGTDTQAALFGNVRQTRSNFNSSIGRTSQPQVESDESVRYLQEQLRNKGFYFGTIDGINGVETQSAVRNFQSAAGLRVDGVAGANTRLALDSYSGQGSTGRGNLGVETYQSPPRDRQAYRRYAPDRNYVVIVPGNYQTLTQVRQYVNGAFLNESRQGSYINAGAFSTRSVAESRSQALRARGLDARVVYFR